MEKFGFKNFKRFKNFPMISLAPITLLVGPNNSGKSSFIKALTFLYFNLAHQQKTTQVCPPFIHNVSFSQNTASNFDWGDFTTTLHRESIGDDISFMWEMRGVRFAFSFGASLDEITLNPSLKATLPIISLDIESDKYGIIITNTKKGQVWETNVKISLEKFLEWVKLSMDWFKGRMERSSYNVLKKIPILRNLEAWDRSINHRFERLETRYADYAKVLGMPTEDQNGYFEFSYSSPLDTPLKKALHDYCDYCVNLISGNRLGKALIAPDFEYIEAHNAPHTNAISADDKNSFLARTVTEFNSDVPFMPENYDIYAWVNKWMKEFKIGDFFQIDTHFGGEILTVGIGKESESWEYRHGGKSLIPLGSLGTGGIQLFILLLKIADVLKRIGEYGFVTIIVEEPEQNLHPALQSKLADLFLEVYKMTDARVRFLVETHSEYLIRRTQVIVAKESYVDVKDLEAKNPFKVYYFPEEGLPYDMVYKPNGHFEEAFGEGFFDEAGKWSRKLIRNNR